LKVDPESVLYQQDKLFYGECNNFLINLNKSAYAFLFPQNQQDKTTMTSLYK